MSDPTDLSITDPHTKQLPDAGRLFEGLQKWQGPLPADVKRRLLALLKEPSQQTWNDAFTILLQPKLTLWMAVQAVDPTFPRTCPGAKGCLWPILDQLTIARALRYARRWDHRPARATWPTRSAYRTKPRRLLDGLASFRGPMSSEAKARLRAVIENPSSATWENTHGLILTPGLGITLWNAVCVVDPAFPIQDERGRRRPWPRMPDQLTVVRAIRAAATGRVTHAQMRARIHAHLGDILGRPSDGP